MQRIRALSLSLLTFGALQLNTGSHEELSVDVGGSAAAALLLGLVGYVYARSHSGQPASAMVVLALNALAVIVYFAQYAFNGGNPRQSAWAAALGIVCTVSLAWDRHLGRRAAVEPLVAAGTTSIFVIAALFDNSDAPRWMLAELPGEFATQTATAAMLGVLCAAGGQLLDWNARRLAN